MGVDFHLKFYAPNRPEAERIAKAAYERVEELSSIFSDYDPAANSIDWAVRRLANRLR